MTIEQTDQPIGRTEKEVELKDYFCPFCNHKLFRGNVTAFKQVCLECNKLVDSTALAEEETKES